MRVFRGLWGGFGVAVGTPSKEVSEADLRAGGFGGRSPGPSRSPGCEEGFGEKLPRRPGRATRGSRVGDSLEGRDPRGPRSPPPAARGP